MSKEFLSDEPYELERYELYAPSIYRFEVDRREFFKLLGSGVVVVLSLGNGFGNQQESGRGNRRREATPEMPEEIGAWIHIGEDGIITVYTGKTEVGQNIRTSLTQAVAEELRVLPTTIKFIMGDTDLTPFDRGTFGSRTTPAMAPQLRKVAATARELLIDLAAEHLKVDRGQLVAAENRVSHPSTKRDVSYSELTKGKRLLEKVADRPALTEPDQWKILGRSQTKVDARAFVTGKHKYTSDIKLPGMLYGKILRPPAIGASLTSLDISQAEAIPNVKVVRDGDFVGVVAPDSVTADEALAAIKASWKTTEQISDKELFKHLKGSESERGGDGRGGHIVGSVKEGLASSDIKLKQTYTVAYIAHAPLEPRAALAEWKEDKLTVWTGTQRPFGVKQELMEAFRIGEDKVRVIVPDTGSGYGGKHTGEAAIEAARLARAAGRPVKIVWTREEEFKWAYFRPAGVIEVESGVKRDGTITSWEFHNYNSGSSGIRTPYEIANQRIASHQSKSPLRQGSYRGLASAANNFAREVHIDELAHELKIDPLKFRLQNLKDSRLRAVLEAAAKAFNWDRKRPSSNYGFGLACGIEKGGYVATCAEVMIDKSGKINIVRAVTAFECGAVVNPDGLKNQIEGSVVMGIGGALFEEIKFEKGTILNAKFSSYRVPRFTDTPILETVLVDRKDLPSAGAGETPIMGIAPAICNAIFDATKIRLRSLPLGTSVKLK
jgi:nicotinate dehydrogenase subunit B